MRDATNIHLDKLIIHIMDPKGRGLELSDIDLPLADNPHLIDFFINHIAGSLKDNATRAARFRNINEAQPSGISLNMFGDLSFVIGSLGLVKPLYGILKNDGRISVGDLAICFYRASNYPNKQFLAILKIDPSRVFRHEVIEDRKGKYVSFVYDRDAITHEKLQKAAFIQTLDPRHPDYDMLLLDKQTKGVQDKGIARFFSETYLDAEEAFDPRKYTARLFTGFTQAQNTVRNLLSIDQVEDLENRVLQALKSERLNLDSWMDGLPYPQEVKEQIDQDIRANIPDREFDLDPDYSEKVTSKIRYHGDFGLKVEVLADYARQVIVSEDYIEDDPGKPPHYRICLETGNWRKVTR